jgi:hypothetical protein
VIEGHMLAACDLDEHRVGQWRAEEKGRPEHPGYTHQKRRQHQPDWSSTVNECSCREDANAKRHTVEFVHDGQAYKSTRKNIAVEIQCGNRRYAKCSS